MSAASLAPATTRTFLPHAALVTELGIPRDRFGPFTSTFARTRDGRHLVGLVGNHLAVLHAATGEVAWWVPLPAEGVAWPPLALLDDDQTAALMLGGTLVGVSLGTGSPVFRVAHLPPAVIDLLPCPDDPRSLYVVGPGGSVVLLDPHTGDVRWDLRASTPAWEGSPLALDVSSDGRWLLTSRHDACDLWDTQTRSIVRRFGCHGEQVRAARLLPGDRVLLASSRDVLRVFACATGELVAERSLDPGLEPSPPIALSHDGARVALARGRYGLHVVSLDDLRVVRVERPSRRLCSLLAEGDGGLALWADGVVTRAAAPTAEEEVFLGRAQALGVGVDAVTVLRPQGVDVLRFDAREVRSTRATTRALAISPDGRFASLDDQRVDLPSGASSPHEAGARVAIDRSGRVVSASTGRVTFGPEGTVVATPALGPVLDLRLSPGGERAFVLHSRQRLLLVDRDGAVASVKLPAPGPFVALDEARLAIWDHRCALTVYDVAAEAVEVKAKAPRRGHAMALVSLAAHAAKGLLAGGGHAGQGVLVDLATGAEQVRWSVGVGAVSVAFSPDGARLVTTADDPFVRTWDVATLLAAAPPSAKKPRGAKASGVRSGTARRGPRR